MNRGLDDNELNKWYEDITKENALLLQQLNTNNSESRAKASEITQQISILNTIQMKILKLKEIRKKIKTRINL